MQPRNGGSPVETRVSAALEELAGLELKESDPSYNIWQEVLGELKAWLFLLRGGGRQ